MTLYIRFHFQRNISQLFVRASTLKTLYLKKYD